MGDRLLGGNRHRSEGVSVIEAMVLVALMGVLMMGYLQMFHFQSRGQRDLANSLDYQTSLLGIQMLLSNSEACSNALAGEHFKGSTPLNVSKAHTWKCAHCLGWKQYDDGTCGHQTRDISSCGHPSTHAYDHIRFLLVRSRLISTLQIFMLRAERCLSRRNPISCERFPFRPLYRPKPQSCYLQSRWVI